MCPQSEHTVSGAMPPNFGPTVGCSATPSCDKPVVLMVTRYLPGSIINAGRCADHADDLRRIATENKDGTWEVVTSPGGTIHGVRFITPQKEAT